MEGAEPHIVPPTPFECHIGRNQIHNVASLSNFGDYIL